MNMGNVWADNIEDKESRESIRLGYVKGDGLLGDVVAAVRDLASAIHETDLYNCPRRELAWLNLYHALKMVEKAAR